MTDYHFEALTPTDYTFLISENPNLHMHVTGVMIFKAGPLKLKNGGVDFEAIKGAYASVLHRIPRYRQRLMWQTSEQRSPYARWMRWNRSDETKIPVWVDDPSFDIDFHIRHTSLPRPGNEDQLKTLAARIAGQQLDRSRPLWEIWVVEGMRGGQYAVVSKMHHCMVDGSSGIDLANIIMHTDPDHKLPPGPAFEPRPAPTQKQLRDDLRREQYLAPFKMLDDLSELRKESGDLGKELRHRFDAVRETFSSGMGLKRSETPLNGDNGPHRIVEWFDTPLEDIKAIRKHFNCTVNDVVLALVTGAFRSVLKSQDYDLTQPFRVAAPVSIWSDRKEGEMGNQIMTWMIELPIHHSHLSKQIGAINETTSALKESNQAMGVKMLTSFMKFTPGLLSVASRTASGPINSFVTNVPGPQFAIYQLGAEMTKSYPVVPLLEAMGVGIGLLSYNGNVCWGITTDRDIMPDIEAFTKALKRALSNAKKAINDK